MFQIGLGFTSLGGSFGASRGQSVFGLHRGVTWLGRHRSRYTGLSLASCRDRGLWLHGLPAIIASTCLAVSSI